MTDHDPNISSAFKSFLTEAPDHAKTWAEMVQALNKANALDAKTSALAYLSVLAALNLTSGIPFHVTAAKNAGAARDEVISAVLLGLPAAGHVVTQSLQLALEAFDKS